MTVQAPQSPELQPSLLPVRFESVAQHVEQGLLRLTQKFDGLAVDDGCYVVFGH